MDPEHCAEHSVRAGAGCACEFAVWYHPAERCAACLVYPNCMDPWHVDPFHTVLPRGCAQDHSAGRLKVYDSLLKPLLVRPDPAPEGVDGISPQFHPGGFVHNCVAGLEHRC